MESLIFVAGIVVLWYFKSSIKGLGHTTEVILDSTSNSVRKSIKAYENDLGILVAEKNIDQLEKITSLANGGTIPTNDDITRLLDGLTSPTSTVTTSTVTAAAATTTDAQTVAAAV